MKIQKKKLGGDWDQGGGSGRVGGQAGCEQRSEASVKIQKKNVFFFLRGVRGGGSGWGGGVRVLGGCERRSEVFEKIQKKKFFFFLGGGVRSGVGEGG